MKFYPLIFILAYGIMSSLESQGINVSGKAEDIKF